MGMVPDGHPFESIAAFLEAVGCKKAGDALREEFPKQIDGVFLGHLKTLSYAMNHFVDLSEMRAVPTSGFTEQEATVEKLLRKLMASGHALSDDKLSQSINTLLSSESFRGPAEVGIAPVDPTLVSGIDDKAVDAYWTSVQAAAAMQGSPPATENVTPDVADAPASDKQTVGDGEVEPADEPALVTVPPPVPCSSAHYLPKRRNMSIKVPFDENDEYHDDDDAGYRIREIFEAELLVELQKASSSPIMVAANKAASTEVRRVAEKPGGSYPVEVDELIFAQKPAPAEEEEAQISTVADTLLSPTAPELAPRSSSPQFGVFETYPNLNAEKADNAANEETPAPEPTKEEPEKAVEIYPTVKQRKQLRYPPSNDSFYPVEFEGAIYDSFNMRVVFERDKTGFEESKEFPIRQHVVVAARYQIYEYLGSAAFSKAVQCVDLETNSMVCMKIIKNDKDFFDQSLDEIKLLQLINCNGDVDAKHCLKLYDYFYHKEHLIIVSELLRDNLYEFSKFNRESGDDPYFTLGRLQKIAHQVLTALEYVHSLRLIHCDLKPENILIKSYSRCEVKVIDFGSSCFVDDHLSAYVQSRSYRAPEVMLGLPYTQKIDIWSLGCIISELWTGYVLFQNDSVQSLLARIVGIIGEFPYEMMTKGKYVPQYFTQNGQLYQEMDGPPCAERGRRLHLLMPKKTSLEQRMRTDDKAFLDFITQLLQLDPEKRPTASEMLKHPWLTQSVYPDGL